jgi:hypothetical protein
MGVYLLKELACCALLAAALAVLMGTSVLAWKAAGKLAGGIRYARVRLTQRRLLEVVPFQKRHAILSRLSAWRSARSGAESELASKTA